MKRCTERLTRAHGKLVNSQTESEDDLHLRVVLDGLVEVPGVFWVILRKNSVVVLIDMLDQVKQVVG